MFLGSIAIRRCLYNSPLLFLQLSLWNGYDNLMLGNDKHPQNKKKSFLITCVLADVFICTKNLSGFSLIQTTLSMSFLQVGESIGTILTISTKKCYRYKSSLLLRNILPSNKILAVQYWRDFFKDKVSEMFTSLTKVL